MSDDTEPTGNTPSGSPTPLPGAGRRRLPRTDATRQELGTEAQGFRPDTGMSAGECDKARDLLKKHLRRKRDHLPPGAQLIEDEKEATYADVATIMSLRLKRQVSADAVRLAAASAHGSNPRYPNKGIGLSPQHHALIFAEADAMELHATEVLRDILNTHFEIVPAA